MSGLRFGFTVSTRLARICTGVYQRALRAEDLGFGCTVRLGVGGLGLGFKVRRFRVKGSGFEHTPQGSECRLVQSRRRS